MRSDTEAEDLAEDVLPASWFAFRDTGEPTVVPAADVHSDGPVSGPQTLNEILPVGTSVPLRLTVTVSVTGVLVRTDGADGFDVVIVS